MNYIRAWRTYRKLTQDQLAERIGPNVSAGTLSSYESGARKPSQARLSEIATALETTPGKLLDEAPPHEDDPEPVPAEVVNIWTHIPLDRRSEAMEMLRILAKRNGT